MHGENLKLSVEYFAFIKGRKFMLLSTYCEIFKIDFVM